MTPALAREAVFGSVLSCTDVRPASFVPEALEGARLYAVRARSEMLLRALAAAEDTRHEDGDETSPADSALRRLEAKVDLLTALVAKAARANQPRDPDTEVEWSACGARMLLDMAPPVGAAGQFRIEPSDVLPEVLVLPARVLACEPVAAGHEVWLAFEPLGGPLEIALERHLFRIHRRAVAEQRRQRG